MMMMTQAAGEKRRSFDGFRVSPTTVCSASEHKRLKTGGMSINRDEYVGSKRDKKDKFGEKIAALQQLVSPFGKTDTASVLHEATGYIRFLHDQLRVLSAPYLQTWIMKDTQETDHYSLRSRGLCLMPVSCTSKIARSNGADIWAP